jgi:hypothetical protein
MVTADPMEEKRRYVKQTNNLAFYNRIFISLHNRKSGCKTSGRIRPMHLLLLPGSRIFLLAIMKRPNI